ncbi:MAG: enoyl-CoA hydratase/isomerase family protein [Bacteroidales bacterium]
MDYQTLKINKHEKWCELILHRPDSLNAINSVLVNELSHFFEEIEKDEECYLIIITGHGKAFAAGADIQEMQDMSSGQASSFSAKIQEVFLHIKEMPQLVVGFINGYALGGGMELAMACDFRIASSKAQFGQPELKLGLVPGFAATQILPRLTNVADALFMFSTAEMLNAYQALELRLVQQVVPEAEFQDYKIKLVDEIGMQGPQALRKIKNLVHKGMAMSFKDGCAMESQEFGSLFGSRSQGEEGMKAFLHKRKPKW